MYKGIGKILKKYEYGYLYVYFPDSGHVKTGYDRYSVVIKLEDLELIKK